MDYTAVLDSVKFNSHGLVPAIASDIVTNEVLMMAWMNRDTLKQTLETGVMTYFSRSRDEVWVKGKSSGNTQEVKEFYIDCDGDTLLFKVEAKGVGAACHEGYKSCFFKKLEGNEWSTQGQPLFDPNKVYGK